MKILNFLIGITLGLEMYQSREHTHEQIYSDDPKSRIVKTFKSNDVVVHKNVRWIERLDHTRSQRVFVSKMINIENTVPLTPDGAYNIVDDSPFCWAILAYNSDHDEVYKGLHKIEKMYKGSNIKISKIQLQFKSYTR